MKFIRLGDICDLKNGYAFKSTDYVDSSNTLNCRMSNIRPGAIFDPLYNPKFLPDEFAEKFSPWIVQASFPGIPGQVMERALSQKGFCISTGSACSSQSKARPVLDSLHISAAEKESAVRFSFGFATTKEGMEDLVKAVKEVCKDFE